jgi:hypothetical protein
MKNCIRAVLLTTASLPLFAATPTPANSVTDTVNRLTKLLTLTTAQAATATSLFTTETTTVQTAQASLATAQTALNTAIEADSGVSAAITTITGLDTTILLAEATADAGLYAVLTSAQQTIYATLLTSGLDGFGNFGTGICLGGGTLASTTSTTTPTVATIVADRVTRLTSLLTLTTAQVATATSLFTTEVNAEQTAQSGIASAQTGLVMAIEANSGTAAAVAGLVALDTQILNAQTTADAAFYATLTTTQQTIDKQLLNGGLDSASTFGPVNGGGHGGPGGGGHH